MVGVIFVNNFKEIQDLPSKINQDIKFVDMETWRVYEHYIINDEPIMNQLGFFDNEFQYVLTMKESFLDRRSDFHGYHMRAMTEQTSPYILVDISEATYDSKSETYDVTNSIKGIIYEIFLEIQDRLNFTASIHKRKDGKFGPTTVSENGTVIAAGITESITSGFAEMIVTR